MAFEAFPGRVRRALLSWYARNRRDLPWRRTRDPYAIWISEAMLQQTRVETVLPYYERFLAALPDVATLADADPDTLHRLWAGLGYYSRARNLQRAARQVVEEHGGRLPTDAEALRSLPGIGRYTAGALASIAFDREEPVVDGNVVRVLSRLRGIRDDTSRRETIESIWEEAGRLVAGPRPGDLNQALMELGATVCVPREPRCLACPVSRDCDARARGDAASLPRKAPRKKPVPVEGVAGWVGRRGRVLAVRRSPGGLLGGLWELPGGTLHQSEAPEEGIHRALREGLGLGLEEARGVGAVEHVFTHRRLRLHVFRCKAKPGRLRRDPALWDAHRWVAPGTFGSLGHGAPARKALALLAGDGP